ncbi:MAG: HD-GYP domain-containing protein [Atopobiaceae bacterium]|nr:HD-GYP domain-containing protein [Atopobiaceae bacterium]MCI2173056.1 HD-GYP domain-containing protein [Atopobiaceae bacterium]MCI2208149.1 HD-GYP domain-containing protein [Atopobiaceae bacterium]
MRGVSVRHRASYDSDYVQDYRHSSMVRVLGVNGSETICYRMEAGSVGCFASVPEQDRYEEYYVVEGCIEVFDGEGSAANEPETLVPGDFLLLHATSGDVEFRVDEEALLICFSTNCVFDSDASKTRSLQALLDRLQEQDGDTASHCERVRHLAIAMTREMDFPPDQLLTLQFAARYHDIGKAKVPADILAKPSRLDAEEYDLIKEHSGWGDEMIRRILGDDVADVIHEHHERIDGSGYPDGITGDRMSLSAKILAVADSYDAMVTKRPYKEGVSATSAVAELRRCSGTQFDTDCVEALVRALQRRGAIPPDRA